MIESCNNTSVGVLVRREGKLLLIERRNKPYGWAPPAGHVDNGESFHDAAIRELKEEVDLCSLQLRLLLWRQKFENQCRRPGGDWHQWSVFEATAAGTPARSLSETRAMRWVTSLELEELIALTKEHLATDADSATWARKPGLEPVWVQILDLVKEKL
jgi:ADP-ribose pyrophosphatase YjhB (NUDIX family)